jgi:hypothetical protein
MIITGIRDGTAKDGGQAKDSSHGIVIVIPAVPLMVPALIAGVVPL